MGRQEQLKHISTATMTNLYPGCTDCYTFSDIYHIPERSQLVYAI